jgi:DtxR family Mn-dependent transcriptional regulator
MKESVNQTQRVLIEDALKHLHECECQQQPGTAHSLAGALETSLDQAEQVLAQLETSGLARNGALTDHGRDYARQVVRAHRLYETYLAQKTGLRPDQWHQEAERMEHKLSTEKVAELAEQLGEPQFDPHGDPIPTARGELPPLEGIGLLKCPVGWEGNIVHIEDEPPTGYAQVVAAGLTTGTRFRVVAADEHMVRLNAEGRLLELSRLAAGHILAAPLEADEPYDETVTRLSTLQPGEQAAVVGMTSAVRGPERNRLLDLGVVPGTVVRVDLVSPSGNPVAYNIRGAAIALRREQADRILIRKN